ncbi:conserved hypothetical protein [Ricinus communis]|uniref:Endonuclease/exonuclease/phosphatase domain-containing protein n=1 Tax=Ricinus communis TaxID=3988 RepID=B9SJP7_RICCO|nr:conserved hypothetical protein [Ricinus communis]
MARNLWVKIIRLKNKLLYNHCQPISKFLNNFENPNPALLQVSSFTCSSLAVAATLCVMLLSRRRRKTLSKCSSLAVAAFSTPNSSHKWSLTGFYGWPEQENKYKTWDLLRLLNPGNTHAWGCVSDFNKVMWTHEKERGIIRSNVAMNIFREAVEDCELMDMGFGRNMFTWSNGQEGDKNIRERLDMALNNNAWSLMFPADLVRHLVRVQSDHSPIFICFDVCSGNNELRRRKEIRRFLFESMWLHHEGCKEAVREGWNGRDFIEKV